MMKHIEAMKMLVNWHDNIKRKQIANAVAANFLSRGNLLLGIPTIIVIATVSAGAVTDVFGDHKWVLVLLGLLATILTVLQAFFNFGDRSAKHQNAANEYEILKRRVQQFLALPPSSDDAFEQSLGELRKTFDDLSRVTPHVPTFIWRGAMKDIPLTSYPWNISAEKHETTSKGEVAHESNGPSLDT